MPNHVSPTSNVNYNDLLLLTSITGLFVSCGTLFYVNGYKVMMNNEPNTEFKAYHSTINGVDQYTKIENIKSKHTNREAFLITAIDNSTFKVAFENDELVQCYKF